MCFVSSLCIGLLVHCTSVDINLSKDPNKHRNNSSYTAFPKVVDFAIVLSDHRCPESTTSVMYELRQQFISELMYGHDDYGLWTGP